MAVDHRAIEHGTDFGRLVTPTEDSGISYEGAAEASATFAEVVGKKGSRLVDTATGFKQKVGSGSLYEILTEATGVTVNPAATAGWLAEFTATGQLTDGIQTAEVAVKPAIATNGDVATIDATRGYEGSGLPLSDVARRPAAAVTGNVCEFDANKDPIDSGIVADRVANAVKGTFPASDIVNVNDVVTTANDCVLIFDVTAASKAITLPSAATAGVGKAYFIYLKGQVGKDLTITPVGTDTVNGAATLVVTSVPSYRLVMITCVGLGLWWANEE